MQRIGNRAPSDIGEIVDEFHNEETEMNYEIYECLVRDLEEGPHAVSWTRFYVAADHDAVGLVTYYDATEAEVYDLRARADDA